MKIKKRIKIKIKKRRKIKIKKIFIIIKKIWLKLIPIPK